MCARALCSMYAHGGTETNAVEPVWCEFFIPDSLYYFFPLSSLVGMFVRNSEATV